MNTFHLEILSPEHAFYTGDCISIVLPVDDGMLGIMAHHTPLTAAIMDGEITFIKPDGEKINCVVTRGMVDVSKERVLVLCETAISPDEIDEEKERRAANEAMLKMKKKQSAKEYALWQLSLNKAVNRLKASSKKNVNM